jgi:hypothetical protein
MTARLSRVLPIAVAGLVLAQNAFPQTAGASGPFTKVPPLSAACYSGNDPFPDRLEAARTAVNAERERQAAVNAKIEKDFQSLDPMVMSQRMQEWMMSNPQEAMQYMQASQQLGRQAQTVAPELNAEETVLRTERNDLAKRYRAAMAAANAPADARMAALNKKLEPGGCGFGDAECGVPPWAYVEYDAILRMRDSAYQAACPQWWGATGQVQGYLRRWREWLTTKYITSWQKIDEVRVQQYAIMKTPAASWKSTIAHQKADEYMREIWTLYQLRDAKARCTTQACAR